MPQHHSGLPDYDCGGRNSSTRGCRRKVCDCHIPKMSTGLTCRSGRALCYRAWGTERNRHSYVTFAGRPRPPRMVYALCRHLRAPFPRLSAAGVAFAELLPPGQC
jgi:hypothetical protein